MIHSAVAREIYTRLKFHSLTGGILDGLKVQEAAQWRIDGQKDLPNAAVVDLNVDESAGRAAGKATILLRTKRADGLIQLTATAKLGAINWVEALQDAVDIAPSTMKADTRLIVHNDAGTKIANELLGQDYTWSYRMAEITDQSFLIQIDLAFEVPAGRRANRRTVPINVNLY